MADDCGPNKPCAFGVPAKPGARTVHCVKFDKDMPGLDRVPWKGELGKRVYENVSQEAWKMWIEHSKDANERIPTEPARSCVPKIMEEQMEEYFFGQGAKLPEGYVRAEGEGEVLVGQASASAFILVNKFKKRRQAEACPTQTVVASGTRRDRMLYRQLRSTISNFK